MRRTKIVATIGPASREPATLERLIAAGVDVVRLNFSHGTHEEHLAVIGAVRAIAARAGRAVALLQDLSGPKIRTGAVRGDAVELVDGARVAITTAPLAEGSAERIGTTYEPLARDVNPGERILLDDGNLELRVASTDGVEVACEVVHGGTLKSRKGMNLPGSALSTPALTEKDRRDLAFGVQHDVDYVALSFVRQARDVEECQALVGKLGGHAPVVAKIEKREALNDLPSILDVTDGVMVARGDLGVEIGTEEVPVLQKRLIEMANAAGKVVITATQMLESMVEHARPTRAEASDVANAILDGTDGIMLSAETAAGRFPVEAVETMARIAAYTESHDVGRAPARISSGSPVARSLARVASTVAEELGCRLIVAFTESGLTAQLVSSYRPSAEIVALTPNERTCRALALWWGVRPLLQRHTPDTVAMIREGEAVLKASGLVSAGEQVLMLAGQSHAAGATNMMRVHTIA